MNAHGLTKPRIMLAARRLRQTPGKWIDTQALAVEVGYGGSKATLERAGRRLIAELRGGHFPIQGRRGRYYWSGVQRRRVS